MANYFDRYDHLRGGAGGADDEEARRQRLLNAWQFQPGAREHLESVAQSVAPPPPPAPVASPHGGLIPDDPRPPSIWDRIKGQAGAEFNALTDPQELLRVGKRTVGDLAGAVGSTLGLITNPVSAAINTAAGTHLSTDMRQTWRDMVGAPEARNATERYSDALAEGVAGGGLWAKGASAIGAAMQPGAVAEAMKFMGASPAMDMVSGAAGYGADQGAQDAGIENPYARMLIGLGAGAVPGLVHGVHSAGAARAAAPEDLIAGSLDGGLHPGGIDPVEQTLGQFGSSPDNFSSPEAAAMAADRAAAAGARSPFNMSEQAMDPRRLAVELDRRAKLQADIDAGVTDPSFAPPPPQRVMPGDVPIVGTPDGQLIRGDDAGGLAGFDRKQFADQAALARARFAAQADPTMAAIVDAPGANQQQKVRSVWDRLQATDREAQADIDRALPGEPLPADMPEAPWKAPTKEEAVARASGHPNFDQMVDITLGTESRGNRYGKDGKILRSPKGAEGEMQVMPGTNRDPGYGVRPARDGSPDELARVGRDYLGAMLKHYGGDPAKMWAAYNAGPGALDHALAKGGDWLTHMPAETQAYVRKNMGRMGGAAEPGPEHTLRVDSPNSENMQAGGFFSSADRVSRARGSDEPPPVREDFQGFEKTDKPESPTNRDFQAGDSGYEARTQSGDSSRPFKSAPDDPEGQPGYWEDRARKMGDEAHKEASDRLEREWAERQRQNQERAKSASGKTRFEDERVRTEGDPSQRYGRNGYGQKPHRPADDQPWHTTDEGIVADKDGKPVAFRNHKEAAKWAAKNQMAGDFELDTWGTNSARVVLKRRANSNYGARPERPTPGAGPVEPPAGRSEDTATRALEAPESDSQRPLSSDPEPQNRSEAPPEREIGPSKPVEPTRPPVTGESEQVTTSRGQPVDTRFEVVERKDLRSSDHPDYDQRLQPRDRSGRSTSDEQVASIASKLDPERLHSSRDAAQGAPIVGDDWMVESGNGRVQAIGRAYDQHPEQAKAYRAMIERKGLSTDGFEQPVLVRRRTTEMGGADRQAFARAANESDRMEMSSTEQARSDAKALSHETLAKYQGGDLATNHDFVRSWANEVASPAERNSLVQANGTVSTDGLRRIKNSLLARAYDDPDLVAKITEDPDTEIRAIGNVLGDTAGDFAALKSRISKGELPKDYDITNQVAETANRIARARREGKSVADLVDQRDMFGAEADPVSRAVTKLMFKDDGLAKPRSAAAIREGLRTYIEEAAKHNDSDLLGGGASKDRALDVLNHAERKLQAREKGGEREAFAKREPGEPGDRAAPAAKTPAKEELQRIRDTTKDRGHADLAEQLQKLIKDEDHVEFGDHPALDEADADGMVHIDQKGKLRILVRKGGDDSAILHEAVHAATFRRYLYLKDAMKGDKAAGAAVRTLEQLRARTEKAWNARPHDRPGSKAIKAAIGDLDEFLAYGLTNKHVQGYLKSKNTAGLWGRFVDGVRNVLGLEPKYGTMLDRVISSGKEILHRAGDDPADAIDRGLAAAAAPKREAFTRRDDGPPEEAFGEGRKRRTRTGLLGRVVDSLVDSDNVGKDAGKIKAAIGEPKSALRAVTRPMQRFASGLLYTNDSRLRALAARFKSSAITDYANQWHALAGKDDGIGRTYHEAVMRESTTRSQRMFEALEPFLKDQPKLDRIREMLTSPRKTVRVTAGEREAATNLRELLKETIEYRKDAGEDIGEVLDGYFPRVLDVGKVVKGRDDFLAKAERLYRGQGVNDPKAAANEWFNRVFDEYAGLDGGFDIGSSKGGGGLGADTAKAREFGKQADELLRPFYSDDMFHTLASYFTGAAKRAEYSRRFGAKGRVGSPERKAWIDEHGTKSQHQVLEDKIRADLRASDEDPRGVLDEIGLVHKSNLGQMGMPGGRLRTTISALHTWNQLKNMDRTTVTSLTELAQGFVRGGPRYGFKFMAQSFHEFGRQIVKAEPSDAARWAEAVGVANDAIVNQALTSRIAADHATAGMQSLLAKYYHAIGLHQYTEGTRVAATTMGRNFIENLVGDLQSPAAKVQKRAGVYLRELGIKDPEAFGEAFRKSPPTRDDVINDRGIGADYGTALMRFVNQTVLIPSRAEKPTWSNHPVGSMAYSLLSYSYGFKKNVLDRAGRLGMRGVKEADLVHLAPASGLLVTAGITALVDTYLRPALFGSGYDYKDETWGEFAARVVDRAGFLGAMSPVVNAFKAFKYDRDLGTSLAGPIIGSGIDTVSKVGKIIGGRNSENTNGTERQAAGAIYDSLVEPALDATAARYLKGAAASAGVFATGNRKGGVLPNDRDAFIDATAGDDDTWSDFDD